MRFAVSVLVIAVLSFLLQLFLPWWSLVIAAFLAGTLLPLRAVGIFFSGFLASALVWWLFAFIIDVRNDFLLSGKIADLFSVEYSFVLLLITGLIAGIAGGFGAISGWSFRNLI